MFAAGESASFAGLVKANEYLVGRNPGRTLLVALQDGKALCGMPMDEAELRELIENLTLALTEH